MEQTLEIAIENAQRQGLNHIHKLSMRIGELSGVVPDALNFAFDVVTEGTIAEGADLTIEMVPVTCYCQHCDINFSVSDLIYECPQCGQLSPKIISGRDIELTSLEAS